VQREASADQQTAFAVPSAQVLRPQLLALAALLTLARPEQRASTRTPSAEPELVAALEASPVSRVPLAPEREVLVSQASAPPALRRYTQPRLTSATAGA